MPVDDCLALCVCLTEKEGGEFVLPVCCLILCDSDSNAPCGSAAEYLPLLTPPLAETTEGPSIIRVKLHYVIFHFLLTFSLFVFPPLTPQPFTSVTVCVYEGERIV